ncbi:hypothetical protein PR202_gb20672 [Eleusine coracana subsp. coracana]|uniref:PAS domain-containing protein n=1 Tax=Eleusine coracana subsp. coracana TaxID=191504 RepID=A0AAV5F953_ELECO|nr:hypothetical protein PR202_gb20672 [Eleusine coracana subsp. coracana]
MATVSSGEAAGPGDHQDHDRRLASSLTARYSDWVLEALDELPGSFLLTDPALAGHPIVYASRGLAALTGYARREVAILNYRRDGSPHWVLLHLAPVFHAHDGSLLHFLAVQVPIAAARRGAPRCAVPAACREEAGRVEEDFPCASVNSKVFVDMDKRGLEAEEPRVASDSDKEKAMNTANSIFSTLNRYSKLTGLVVCGKRCDSFGIPALSSSLNLSLGRIKQSFVLTDPNLPDNPIIYVSDAFLSLTGYYVCSKLTLLLEINSGYSREEILGSNCRFLNGPGTSMEVLEEINRHVCSEKACTVDLLNYRKDGSSFRDLLHVSPIRDASGKVAFHIWVHLDVGTKHDFNGLTPEVWQLGAVGAVRVAVRGLSASGSLLRPSR